MKTNTFCVVEDNLLLDPTSDEVAISNYYFSVILFDDDGRICFNLEYMINKNRGDLIRNNHLLNSLTINI